MILQRMNLAHHPIIQRVFGNIHIIAGLQIQPVTFFSIKVSSMIICNFDLFSIIILPLKTDTPPLIYTNAVLHSAFLSLTEANANLQ